MLPTAQVLAKSLRMPRVTSESLFHPDPNIKLGAHYLASLLRQFKGNAAHALAAYNAGPLAVKRWRASLPDAELDEWVEEIPISETRGYVKRVLRTYNTYRLLYGREAWSEPPLLSRLLSP
jgi:soluble lytic murein transglycosylase